MFVLANTIRRGVNLLEKFNENIERICVKRGIRKKDLIAHVGIRRSTFYAKLAGVRPWLLEEAVKVADFFGMSIDELVS